MNYLIAGLGNIGAEYADTRHNVGFMTLDAWADDAGVTFQTQRYGDVAEISFKGRKLTLLKPSTYMNLSGNAVRYWMNKLNIPVENILVICDDLNLPFGTLRMRKKGSDGGHNGLKNINECLESQEYARVRLGIGNDFSRGHQVDFVLGKLSEEELKMMELISEKVIAGVKAFATIGVDRAMNSTNCKVTLPEQPTPTSAQTAETTPTEK